MKFRVKVKHINKKLAKYSRTLLVAFSIVGILLSFFISNVNQFRIVRGDSFTHKNIAGLSTNQVYRVEVLDNDQIVTFTNQWSESTVEILHHSNPADYSQFTTYETDIQESTVDGKYFFGIDPATNSIFVVDEVNNLLRRFNSSDYSTSNFYAMPSPSESISMVTVDPITGDVFVAQESRLVRFPYGNLGSAETYNFPGGFSNAIAVGSLNGEVQVLFSDTVQTFPSGDWGNPIGYFLGDDGNYCAEGLKILNNKIYISDGCDDDVLEYDTSFNLLNTYSIDNDLRDFTANNDYVYLSAGWYVTKYNIGDTIDATISDTNLSDVDFRSISLINNDVIALSSWYKELHRFNLVIGGGGSDPCPPASPEYALNLSNSRCERFIFSNEYDNNNGSRTADEILLVNGAPVVLHRAYSGFEIYYNGSIYSSPSGYSYALRMRADNSGSGVYILAVDDINSDPYILYFDLYNGVFSTTWDFAGGSGDVTDFIVTPNSDLVAIQQEYSISSNLVIFPSGDYDNPYLNGINSLGNIVTAIMQVDSYNNLYITSDNAIKILTWDSFNQTYVDSGSASYTTFGFPSTGIYDLFVKEDNGNIDLYFSGSSSGAIGQAVKLANIQTDGTYNDSILYEIGYGQYNSYGLGSIYVDSNNNLFVVPTQSDNTIAWFTPEGNLHDFNLDLVNGDVVDITGNNSNDIYVTSRNIEYQKYNYDWIPGTNIGGLICTDFEYTLNQTRCERYIYSYTDNNILNSDTWDYSLIKNGYFIATDGSGIFIDSISPNVPNVYTYLNAPTDYSGLSNITEDTISNGIFVQTSSNNNSGYPAILYLNLDDLTFSPAYETLYSSGNFDMEVDSDGSLYLLYNPSFGFADLRMFEREDYNNFQNISIDFSFYCSQTPVLEKDKNDNFYALCGRDLRILTKSSNYQNSSEINLENYNFPNSNFNGGWDLFVMDRLMEDDVDIYIAGTTADESTGHIHKFSSVNTSGVANSNDEYLVDLAEFNSSTIHDIYVDNLGTIIATSNYINDKFIAVNAGGNISYVNLADVDGGVADVVIDYTNYNVYITSDNISYQVFYLDFDTPTSSGTLACVIGGDLTPLNIFQGDPVHTNAWVDGDPNNPPPYPTGYIEIRANGIPISTAILNSTANSSHDFTSWFVGTNNIEFYYPGDENFAPCQSTIGDLNVTALSISTNDSTTTVPSVTPNNRIQITGEYVTIDSEVRDPNNNSLIPTGDVELRREFCCSGDFDVLATGTLDSNGNYTFSLKDLYPGNYFLYVQYLGDSTYANSRSNNFTFDIVTIQTFLTLESSDISVTNGESITLTAQLSYPNFTPSNDSFVEMSGWVLFVANGVQIGDVLMDSNGTAVLNVNTSNNPVALGNLNSGVHHIRAIYRPFHEDRNRWLRRSTTETLFQTVSSTDNSGGSNSGTDIPPEGGEGGNSDFSAVITGKDKVTGSLTQTKIGSILEWTMNYNNLGPNSNEAVTYFPIRESQEFVVGSIVVPVNWTTTYSQDQSCDDSTFNYTPVGPNGGTDPLVRCVRFENERVNVPPTRSDIRYITTQANFSELNVQALGGTDVWKVMPYNNKLYYLNHHEGVNRIMPGGRYHLFCFDLEINDTCVSNNPNIVYPINLGIDGYADPDDEFFSAQSSFASNAEIVNGKLYTPFTNVTTNSGVGGGHGFFCWDVELDYYCSGGDFVNGFVKLTDVALGAWALGNIGDIQYNPDLQELYSVAVGPNNGYMAILCYSLALNSICPGQPFDGGSTVQGYDPGWGMVEYQASTGRIYYSGGGDVGSLDRQIQCLIAATKTLCPDFPAEGVQILPNKPNQSVFINPHNDQMCAFLYSDGAGSDNTPPALYCYDPDSESFYDYLPDLANIENANDMYRDFSGPYEDGRIYFMAKWNTFYIYCYDLDTKQQCPGWEGGKTGLPFDDRIYTFRESFGCMWGASDSGRVFAFDGETGLPCNPLITLTEGSVAVKMDGTGMFCANPDDITWNKVKVLDSGTSPAPAVLNATVFDSAQCNTDEDGVVTCNGSPLKSGNLLLNSGHELDISDISYSQHNSLTAILEFQYPSIPSPAPGFYIELNPTNKAQMCAETKLVFSGALCANPITTVCENTNISYINDPVSNNNGGQYCLNVETYFGKDPNSALCFVAATPEQRIFTVFNPNATVSTGGIPNFNPEETYNRGPRSYSFGNGFFGFFQNIIQNTIPEIITEERVVDTISSVTAQTPLAVSAVTAVTTASVVATSVVAGGSSIGQVFGALLGIFAPKKRKYWGIVVDDLTNKPIAFASIILSIKEIGPDNQMKTTVIAQSVSDLDGRYRLNTDKRDNFYLDVKAIGYQPFTKIISMANPLSSAEDIVYDVPLRRIDEKSNFFKTLLSYRKKSLINFARAVLLVSSIIGFLFTIYSQINFPDNLNLILLGVYIVIFIISFYPSIYNRIQKKGKVIDVDLNVPIPGAVVRIYDSKQQIALALTNSKGEARFDLPSGQYSILTNKRGYKMITEEGKQLIQAILKQEGYLDRNILMKRIEEAPATQGGLDNPFS